MTGNSEFISEGRCQLWPSAASPQRPLSPGCHLVGGGAGAVAWPGPHVPPGRHPRGFHDGSQCGPTAGDSGSHPAGRAQEATISTPPRSRPCWRVGSAHPPPLLPPPLWGGALAGGASPSALRAGVGGAASVAAERRVGFSPQGPCQGCTSVSSPAAGEHRHLWGVLDADATREGVNSMAVLLLPGLKRCVRGPQAGPSGRVLASHTDRASPPSGLLLGAPQAPPLEHSLPLLMLLLWLACGLLFPTFPFWPFVILSSTCAGSGLWALERRDLGPVSLRDWSLELPGGVRARRLVGMQMFPAQPPGARARRPRMGAVRGLPGEMGR